MAPEEAEGFGLRDGDEVEVAISGGPRDLVFRHVLVRVRPDFRLEMHIDADEAGAAGLPLGSRDGFGHYPGMEAIRAEILRRTFKRG